MKLKKKLSLLLASVMLANSLSVVTSADNSSDKNTQQDSVVSGQGISVDENTSSHELDIDATDKKDFDIEFKVNNDWGNGFNGEIAIKNNTSKAIENWKLEFDFEHNIDSLWNGIIGEHTDDHYVVFNAGYNNKIEPDSTITVGFNGTPGLVNSEPKNYVLSFDGGSFSAAANDDNSSSTNVENNDSVVSSDDDMIEIENTEIFNFSNNKYALFDDGMTWDDAQNYCESLGGHLVAINSEEENEFICDTVLSEAKKSYYWLGGSKDSEGVWNWVTGEELNFTNWESSEPNNYAGTETVIHLYKSGKKWNDASPGGGSYGIRNFGFICEWEDTGVQVVARTPFDYALFTGNNDKDLSLYTNNTTINGDIHSNSGFYFQGNNLNIDGICETVNNIDAHTSSGSTSKITSKQENANVIEMLDISDKVKNKIENGDDDVIYFGQDKIEIENGLSSDNSIFFNGTTFTGTGFICAENDIVYNVNSLKANNGQIFLCSESGNIDFHGSEIKINGIIYAPNGTVTINANSFELNGRIICDKFIFNGTTLKINAQDNDLDFIRDILQKEDIYAPEITLSSNQKTVNVGDEYTITATANDESKISNFRLYVNDELISEKQGEIKVKATQIGQNVITCVAEDEYGNESHKSIVVDVVSNGSSSYEDDDFYITVNFDKTEYFSGEKAKINLSSNKQSEVETLKWYFNGEYIGEGLSATNGLAFVEGINTLKVVATTLSGETAESTAVCNYTSRITNVAANPVITSPKQGESVSSVVKITGEVTFLSDSEKLENYTLEYKPYLDIIDYEKQLEYRDSDEGYKVLESGSVLENNALNYLWNTTTLEDNNYFIRFTATNNYGIKNHHIISVQVNNNNSDIEIPLLDTESDVFDTVLEVSKTEVNIGDKITITHTATNTDVKSSKLYINDELVTSVLGYTEYTFAESGLYSIKFIVEDKEGKTYEKEEKVFVKGAGNYYENGVYINLSKAKLEVGEEAVLTVQKDDTVTDLKVSIDEEETELTNTKITLTSNEPKRYKINITYTKDNEEISKTLYCEFFNKGEIPYATAILNIEDCPAITAPTAITGTASDSVGISKYELFYKEKDSSDWTLFASGTENVDNAELGTFDPTLLENGVYDIKLEVTDANGNISSVTEPVIVEGNLKIGVFNIGFTDLVTNLGGINLTLSRNYSTSKSDKSGDFGYGWSLGLTGLKVYETNPIYEGYYNSLQGSQLSTTYYTTQTKKHYVVVNYGNGETDKFELNLSPNPRPFMTSKQVELTFNCVSNKTSKLEIVGDNKAYFNSETGEGILYEDGIDYYNIQKYKITRKDGTVIIYDKTTGVESITDKNGNTITVTENGFEGSNGEKILITKDFEGRITSITNKKGNVRTYVYNKNGDLSSSFDFLNNEVKYIYDSEHHLIDIVDSNGVAVEKNIYDEDGRLIAVIDALGNRTDCDYTFASSNNCQTVKDENGNTTFYYYDDKGNLLSKTDAEGNRTKYTYDENGNKTSFTDENNYTSYYKYDDYNNLISATNNLGYKIEYTYNKYGQITSEKDSTGSIKSRTYDENGNLLSEKASDDSGLYYEYDTFGNCILEKNDSGIYYKKKYDTAGNLVKVTDNTGNYTEYLYDDNGNLVSETYKDCDGNILKKDNYLYDDCDRITSFTDITGNSYNCKYDKNGHKTEETDTFGNTVTYSYDEAGNMTQKLYSNGLSESFCYDSMGNKTKYTDIYGNNTEYYYNKIGKKIKVKYDNNTYEEYQYTPTGLISSFRSKTGAVTKYEYDAVGNNISVTDAYNGKKKYYYDSLNRKISETDELGNEIKYEYNVYGLISKVIYPDKTFETYTYDNILNKTSETDRGGNTKYYTYDSFGNLTKVTDALGGEYQYTYDKNSNLISVIDANKNVTQYDYNNIERLLNTSLPMGMSDNSNYNNNGLLSSYTDFNGNTLSYLYNEYGKIQSQNYNNNTINFIYDKYGNISKVSDKENDYTYIYDGNGLLDKCNFTSTDFVDYEYDAFGNISSISTPYSEIKYNYDILNRVDSVIDKEGNETQYSYDAAGNIVSKLLPNGTEVAYRYDNCNRITSESIYDRNNILVDEYSYSYTTSGNISQIKDNSGKITKYTYDNLYRLIREETFQEDKTTDLKEYTYDNVGNRLSMNDNGKLITYTYDNNDRLIAEGENTYYYDNNGSLTKIITPDGSKEYSYNEQGQLEKVIDGENTTEYKYDYLGNRICSISNGVKTNYVWDNSFDNPELLYQVTGDEVITYTYADTLISQNDTGNTSYYISDAQKNVRYLMDNSGNVTDSYSYSAFGCLKEHTGDSENEMLFAEQQYDSNIELYYLRARYMNPQNGNFISRDSYFGNIEEPLSLNKYIYAQNNPVNYYDPSGMYIEKIIEGRMAHVIIEYNYWKDHIPDIPENYKHTYVKGLYNGVLTRGFIDIYNAISHEIYEIKPNSQESIDLGYIQLDTYKRLLQPEKAVYGNSWPIGEVSFPWPLGSGSLNYRRYKAGIITYDLCDINSEYTWANFAKINAEYGVAQVGALAASVGILYKSIPSLVEFVNTSRNLENNLIDIFSRMTILMRF